MLTSSLWPSVIAVAVLGVSLANCSSGGSGNGAGLTSGDVSHFIDQAADEMCAVAAQCCPATGHTTPTNCATSARAQLHADIDKEIAAGIGLNTDAANRCLAAYH